jgi:hypothetical protein
VKFKTNYLNTCINKEQCKAEGCTEEICSGKKWDDNKPCVFYEDKRKKYK